jgi:hypothetical protein
MIIEARLTRRPKREAPAGEPGRDRMLMRLLVVLILAFGTTAAMPAASAPAIAQFQPFPVSEMMRATGLDEVFTQFGATIAASAREQEITSDEVFLRRWESTALAVFDAGVLRRRLADALDGQFSVGEQSMLGGFFRSDFGRHITEVERAVALLDPGGQQRAIVEGQQLIDEAGVVRTAQLDSLMRLVTTEISATMVGQSVRAMLMGMAVSHQRGDIAVPWSEIDAQVTAMMPDLQVRVSSSQRALMAYAYSGLSDDELGRYIAFLRTPAAQRFYATAAIAVGHIVTQGMSAFGEAFAARMESVQI